MATYYQKGESIDYTNTGDAVIKGGDVLDLTERVGVAGCDIPVGGVGSVHVTGVFVFPKATGAALTVGQAVDWDEDAQNITADEATPAGWVVEPAAATDTTVKVKIG
jgi:predicted RecA/RadA family phage recombinase